MSRRLPVDSAPLGAPFSRLYRKHGPLVRSALRQLGVAPASVEDATQDVFVVLHRRAAQFDRTRSLENWLWGIARGVASTYRRSDRRRFRLLGAVPRERASESLDRELARGEAVGILDRFLDELDPDKCAVFVLAEIEGRTGPEIARMLSVNVNTVYARLRVARRCFREAMRTHRVDGARPLFASWLPLFAAPRAASLFGGAGVLAVALAMPQRGEPEPPVVALSVPTIPDATPRDDGAARIAASRLPEHDPGARDLHVPAPQPTPTVLELDPRVEPAPAAVRSRPRAQRAAPTSAPSETVDQIDIASEAEADAEARARARARAQPLQVPALAPWGDTIVARAPRSTRSSLIEVEHDFTRALVHVTAGL